MSVVYAIINIMRITIETKKSARKLQEKLEKQQLIAAAVVRNFEAEINANPELLETLYTDEFSVAFELKRRMEDLMLMEKEADKMSGGLFGKIAYKFSRK